MGRERDHRAGQLCSSNPSFMLQQVETQYWLPRQEQKSKFGEKMVNACGSGGGCPGGGSAVRAPGSPEADFQKTMANSSKVTEMSRRACVA